MLFSEGLFEFHDKYRTLIVNKISLILVFSNFMQGLLYLPSETSFKIQKDELRIKKGL